METPLVSIACITFNQEKFVRECLDGFVMQQTNFPIEIVIHDDASTDSTQNIIREYINRYPHINWHPILQTENKYKLGKGILAPYVFPECKGKYIALCEGDDYWTDPLKLQKQVDFLEANPDYSMCFHNATEHWEDNSHADRSFSNIEDREYTGLEIFEHWTIPTASVVFRKEVVVSTYYNSLCNNPRFCYGDIILFIACANNGKLQGIKQLMSVYRRHGDSAVFTTSRLRYYYHNVEIFMAIGGEYKESARRIFFNCLFNEILNDNRIRPLNKIKAFCTALRLSPIKAIWRLIFHVIKKPNKFQNSF